MIDDKLSPGACTRRPAMTPRQIRLVQSTWAQVEPIGMQAAALFYARLFERDPSLHMLFSSDLPAQSRKLLAMIGAAVRGLDRADELLPAVRSLRARHADHGGRCSRASARRSAPSARGMERGLRPLASTMSRQPRPRAHRRAKAGSGTSENVGRQPAACRSRCP